MRKPAASHTDVKARLVPQRGRKKCDLTSREHRYLSLRDQCAVSSVAAVLHLNTCTHTNQTHTCRCKLSLEEEVSKEIQGLMFSHLVKLYHNALCIDSTLKNITNVIYQTAKQPDYHSWLTPNRFPSSCLSLVHSSKPTSCPPSPTGTNLFITPCILAPSPCSVQTRNSSSIISLY